MLMKKLLLYILIGGILLIGTYVTTEIELADAVYHRDTVLDPAAE